MRVALVAPPWLPVPPPAYGGTEAVIDRLARGLLEEGHDVVLLGTADSTCPVPLVPCTEAAQRDAMGMVPPALDHVLTAYEWLGRATEAGAGFDVVHDHTLAGPLLARHHLPADVALVTTNHGPFDATARRVFSAAAGLAGAAVVAISHHQASTAGDVPVRQVIHHGIDLDRFPAGPGGGGYLLFLGRMAPGKGVAEACDVARRAGWPLLIAAKCRVAEECEYYETHVKPRLGGDIAYLGEVDEAGRLELLRHADALLNPIRWPEPFGLVMIEALACGTPVLAGASGSAPEVVEHGVTGAVGDGPDDLLPWIERLPELDRAACRRAAETRFSTERMVADHLALYRALVVEHLPTPALHLAAGA